MHPSRWDNASEPLGRKASNKTKQNKIHSGPFLVCYLERIRHPVSIFGSLCLLQSSAAKDLVCGTAKIAFRATSLTCITKNNPRILYICIIFIFFIGFDVVRVCVCVGGLFFSDFFFYHVDLDQYNIFGDLRFFLSLTKFTRL